MGTDIELFDATRLVDIASFHHPIGMLPATLTGLGRIFLGVAQLRAQNKIFELEAQQLQNDWAYKQSLVAAQKDLGIKEIERRRLELVYAHADAKRKDILRALEITAASAESERHHQEQLLLIEDSYQLAMLILRQREFETRSEVLLRRQAIAAATLPAADIGGALMYMTQNLGQLSTNQVGHEANLLTIRHLSSDLAGLGSSAFAAVSKMLDASRESTEKAFMGLYEIRA